MKVTITSIAGFAEAFESMYISKRNWTESNAKNIRRICHQIENNIQTMINGENIVSAFYSMSDDDIEIFKDMIQKFKNISKKHITLGRFIDVTIMTEGIHRGAQDDIDSHARRFENRIVRSSTRLANFNQDEFSSYYSDKVMTTDNMLLNMNKMLPDTIVETKSGDFIANYNYNGGLDDIANIWMKTPNGFCKREYYDNKDVRRGLYMLGIPSNFISKINITEFAHVYKLRNNNGSANPEVKQWAETVMNQIYTLTSHYIDRDYIMSIDN